MGEIRRVSLARGKRVIKVAPVDVRRDPQSRVALAITDSLGSNMALLTEDERRALIEALGGEVT